MSFEVGREPVYISVVFVSSSRNFSRTSIQKVVYPSIEVPIYTDPVCGLIHEDKDGVTLRSSDWDERRTLHGGMSSVSPFVTPQVSFSVY